MPNTATPPDRTTAGRVIPGTAILWNFDNDKGSVPVTFRRRFYQDNAGNDLGNKVRLGLELSTGENVITQPVGKATRIQLDPGSWNQAAADALTVGPADELGPVVTNAAGERVGVPAPEVRAELAKAMDSIRPTAATVGKTPDEIKAAAEAVVAVARATVPQPASPAVEAALTKAREKHRPDEAVQPITVEPLIERVRAERAAALDPERDYVAETASRMLERAAAQAKEWPANHPVAMLIDESARRVAAESAPAVFICNRSGVLSEDDHAAVQQFSDALASEAASRKHHLIARIQRPIMSLTITNGHIDDVVVSPEHPENVGLLDYQTRLEWADQCFDEFRPGWRTTGSWALAGVTAEVVLFTRPIEHI